MPVFIPDLFGKYGGPAAVAKIVREFSSELATLPGLRRLLSHLTVTEVATLNMELISFALGRPIAQDESGGVRLGYRSLNLSNHAYEEIIRLLRMTLLRSGFESRDATIAINVLDMHAAEMLGVRLSRQVTSPFAGVDRRRFPRNAESPRPRQA